MLALIRQLRSRGAPLHYLGVQSHLATTDSFSDAGFGKFLLDVRALDVDVHITELDVRDLHSDVRPAQMDARVADTLRRFFDVALAHGAVTSVTTWGMFDDTSWLQTSHPRPDGVPHRPLPYSARMQWKPILDVLQSVGQRLPQGTALPPGAAEPK